MLWLLCCTPWRREPDPGRWFRVLHVRGCWYHAPDYGWDWCAPGCSVRGQTAARLGGDWGPLLFVDGPRDIACEWDVSRPAPIALPPDPLRSSWPDPWERR